jgi:hypothetical protein
MRLARIIPDRHMPRVHWTRRRGEFMTPLPPRRRPRHAGIDTGVEFEEWDRPIGFGAVRGGLRFFAAVLLALVVIVGLLMMLSELWM